MGGVHHHRALWAKIAKGFCGGCLGFNALNISALQALQALQAALNREVALQATGDHRATGTKTQTTVENEAAADHGLQLVVALRGWRVQHEITIFISECDHRTGRDLKNLGRCSCPGVQFTFLLGYARGRCPLCKT